MSKIRAFTIGAAIGAFFGVLPIAIQVLRIVAGSSPLSRYKKAWP